MKQEGHPETVPASAVSNHQTALARRKRVRQIVIPYMFLLPFLVLFALFLVLPLAYAFGLSIFEGRVVGGSTLVGADEYVRGVQGRQLWAGMRRMGGFG